MLCDKVLMGDILYICLFTTDSAQHTDNLAFFFLEELSGFSIYCAMERPSESDKVKGVPEDILRFLPLCLGAFFRISFSNLIIAVTQQMVKHS